MPSQANQPLPDGYPLQNYRVSGVLSCGGFSIVYLASDENERSVAIKEYLPSQLALRTQGDALPSVTAFIYMKAEVEQAVAEIRSVIRRHSSK